MATKKKKPTPKQQKFIECYDGKLQENAKSAGITYGYAKQLMCLRKYRHVQFAITARERTRADEIVNQEVAKRTKQIATRQQRQKFWTDVLYNKIKDVEITIRDRLKASELLARSEGDFIERRKIEFDTDLLDAIFTTLPPDIAAELRIRLVAKLSG